MSVLQATLKAIDWSLGACRSENHHAAVQAESQMVLAPSTRQDGFEIELSSLACTAQHPCKTTWTAPTLAEPKTVLDRRSASQPWLLLMLFACWQANRRGNSMATWDPDLLQRTASCTVACCCRHLLPKLCLLAAPEP